MAQQKKTSEQAAATEGLQADDFNALLEKEFKPKSNMAKTAVENAVQTLAEQVLSDTVLVSEDAVETIKAMIGEIDKKLSDQVNEVMHHPDFVDMEGTWRGLHHLVYNTATDEHMKIKVFNVSKKDLLRTLKRYEGTAWDQSPIYKQFCEFEYEQFGGEPYACIVGDYYFDHSPKDVKLLTEMSKVAASAHAPFIASASPTLMQMDTWEELANPKSISGIFSTPEYAAWRTLRDSEDSRYIGLAMPRTLARLPYGNEVNPVEEFNFQEDTDGDDSSKYVWSNAAYSMATNINRAFSEFGWTSRIRGVESGGRVDGLPVHTFPSDDGGTDMKIPTETAISDRREQELAKAGLMPLIHKKNSDVAAFLSAQSLQNPSEYEDSDATANAQLAARLPYLFAACRFAHYLKAIVRDKIGSFREREAMERWLQVWIMNYVDGDPENSSEAIKAQRPLAAAEVVVEDVEGMPGYYEAKFYLRPHYQLEGLKASLRLVSKLPSEKGAS